MSDVSGAVWNEIVKAMHATPRDGSPEHQVAMRDGIAAEATGNIIRIIREALLGEAAVEALAAVEDAAGNERYRQTQPKLLRIWDMTSDNPRCSIDYRGTYRHIMPIVLDAAGITEDDDE